MSEKYIELKSKLRRLQCQVCELQKDASTEIDPVFSASPAFGITTPNINAWNSIASGNYITTNTSQTGLTGDKTTSGLWTFTAPFSTGQATFGSLGQGGKINFINGTGGTTALTLGLTSSVNTGGLLESNSVGGLYIRNTGSTGLVSIESTGASGYVNFITGNTQAARLFVNGNFRLSTIATDDGSKLRVDGTTYLNGSITVDGNITASAAIARGMNITSTLTSAANNDVLVGLNINPTFVNGGSHAGLTNLALRVTGNTLFNNNVDLGGSINLRAGTATAGTYPIKFTSGPLLTTAVAGVNEFLTDKFYGTITTGAARKEFTMNDGSLTSGRLPFATTNGRLTDNANLSISANATTLTANVRLDMTPAAFAGGTNPLMLINGAAHTNMTTAVETIDVHFNLGRIVQFAAGAKSTQRAFLISAPTYSAVSATTTTNSATFAITGAPVEGTNMTITNPYALWVQGGTSLFAGTLRTTGLADIYGGTYNAQFYTMVLGGDSGAPSTRTTATTKFGRITGVHYDNNEEPVGLLYYTSTASINTIYFGSGHSSMNAANILIFSTATGNNVTTGTNRMIIYQNGNVVINNATDDTTNKLQVTGSVKITTDINAPGLQVFADNTAAAGLAIGTIYKTATGELRIKI